MIETKNTLERTPFFLSNKKLEKETEKVVSSSSNISINSDRHSVGSPLASASSFSSSSSSSRSSSSSSSSSVASTMTVVKDGDYDGTMTTRTTSLPPAAEGTETSEIGDYPHDEDSYNTNNTKTKTKTAEKKREVRFHPSVDVRYIETKDEMPHREEYWLTPYDLYQIKNGVQKALSQKCPSVKKYQPHEVISIQRKFKSLSRNILRQQEKNKRLEEEIQKKLDSESERMMKKKKQQQSKSNNIFGFLFNNNNDNKKKNKDIRTDDDENDDCQNANVTTVQKLKDELKTFHEEVGPENIAQLYHDITTSDVLEAIQVAAQLEQELLYDDKERERDNK